MPTTSRPSTPMPATRRCEFMTDGRVRRDKSAPAGRARALRHAGACGSTASSRCAGLAVPLLALQGAGAVEGRRQGEDRHPAGQSGPRWRPPIPGASAPRPDRRTRTPPSNGSNGRPAPSMLADFGKTWLNPVPRASAIEQGAGRSDLDQRRGQGGDRGLRRVGGGLEDHEHGAAILRSCSTCSASSSPAPCRRR